MDVCCFFIGIIFQKLTYFWGVSGIVFSNRKFGDWLGILCMEPMGSEEQEFMKVDATPQLSLIMKGRRQGRAGVFQELRRHWSMVNAAEWV